ncbi:MAG: LytTR family DNA-binding domain-containing protein [Pacificimonas sp.]
MSGPVTRERRGRELVIGIAIAALVGVVLGILGPFGSYQMGGVGVRIAYWVPLIVIGYLLFVPSTWIAVAVAERLDLNVGIVLTVSALIMAFPMTFVVATVSGAGALPWPIAAEAFWLLYAQVAVISVGMNLLFYWRARIAPLGAEETASPTALPIIDTPVSSAEAPPLLAKLPAGHDGAIHALESEDHYVRVHGDGRSDLLLMRLADAIIATGDLDGLQVHRSWWVAAASVEGLERDGRNMTLQLTNGLTVPVSRANQAAATALRPAS